MNNNRMKNGRDPVCNIDGRTGDIMAEVANFARGMREMRRPNPGNFLFVEHPPDGHPSKEAFGNQSINQNRTSCCSNNNNFVSLFCTAEQICVFRRGSHVPGCRKHSRVHVLKQSPPRIVARTVEDNYLT
jgi:hypothetical protein